MGPLDKETRERNRELIAERLKWPEGALQVCRELERQHAGYSVFWGEGRVTDPKPGFYAMRVGEDWNRPSVYGETAVDLGAALAEDMKRPRLLY